ncbi:MAG: hypothetical protein LBS79_04120 [Tannerella sp.]|nr:hypothetical protein [Tannerella sp.]
MAGLISFHRPLLWVHIIEPSVSIYKTSVTDTEGSVRFAFAKTQAPFLTPCRRKTWPPAIRFRMILTHYDSYPAPLGYVDHSLGYVD